MNVTKYIIRFGIGTLVAAGSALSLASEPVVDLAAADIVDTSSSSVSADIASRHEQFVLDDLQASHCETSHTRRELKLVDDMARQLDAQLERRLASQLDRSI